MQRLGVLSAALLLMGTAWGVSSEVWRAPGWIVLDFDVQESTTFFVEFAWDGYVGVALFPLRNGEPLFPILSVGSDHAGVEISEPAPSRLGAHAGSQGPFRIGYVLSPLHQNRIIVIVAGDGARWTPLLASDGATVIERARGTGVFLWDAADFSAVGVHAETPLPTMDVTTGGSRAHTFDHHPFGLFNPAEQDDVMIASATGPAGSRACDCQFWGPYGDEPQPPGTYIFEATGARATLLGTPFAIFADVELPS